MGMLFVAGKGDGNVRYFEYTREEPYLHFISNYGTQVPQKGFCFAPKRCVDTKKHEVMFGLKLETTAIVPVSFKVPRKSEIFQEDLFPDCISIQPAMTSEQWLAGENREPVLRSMRPGTVEATAQEPVNAAPMLSMKDLKKMLEDANKKIQDLEKENAALKTENEALKAGGN